MSIHIYRQPRYANDLGSEMVVGGLRCVLKKDKCAGKMLQYIYICISKIANLNSVWMSAAAYVVKVPTA